MSNTLVGASTERHPGSNNAAALPDTGPEIGDLRGKMETLPKDTAREEKRTVDAMMAAGFHTLHVGLPRHGERRTRPDKSLA